MSESESLLKESNTQLPIPPQVFVGIDRTCAVLWYSFLSTISLILHSVFIIISFQIFYTSNDCHKQGCILGNSELMWMEFKFLLHNTAHSLSDVYDKIHGRNYSMLDSLIVFGLGEISIVVGRELRRFYSYNMMSLPFR